MADMRYTYIEAVCQDCVVKHQETKEQIRSEQIDRVLTHKYAGIPIFLLVMLLIFWLTFSVLGAPLQKLLESGISWFSGWLSSSLSQAHVSEWLQSLLINGVCAGVGSVLSFCPLSSFCFSF